ncbi:MAG: HAMP domain-containing histidine kinase [Rhodobacteraceae bacterium]|nr:HAMP domain-containing histidine kinase [Paracoccaceae bacterium]
MLYEQTMVNLLVKDRQAMAHQDVSTRFVNISFSVQSGNVTILIRDTGPGIPKKFINRVFDPAFSTKRAESGSGIGLYMSKTVIDEMHGCIKALDVDLGACIEIVLPKIST